MGHEQKVCLEWTYTGLPVGECRREGGNQISYNSLVETSIFFNGVPEEKLLKIGVPQEAIGRVMSIKNLNDLHALKPLLPLDAYEN